MNYLGIIALLAVLTALILAVGYLVGEWTGAAVALLMAAASSGLAYLFSDRLVLWLYNANPVVRRDPHSLFDVVRDLADRAGLPMPKVYVINEIQPNAFAVGRDPRHASVAVTTGLIRALRSYEVAAVISHELAHIKNGDTPAMTIAAGLGGSISTPAKLLDLFGDGRIARVGGWLLRGALMAAFMPLALLTALLARMANSEDQEFEADAMGAVICGQPLHLAHALRKISGGGRNIRNKRAELYPGTAHLFFLNPLRSGGAGRIFKTRPTTKARVRRLERMAERPRLAA